MRYPLTDKELALSAINAMKKSYAPYSGFNVGAALLTKSGKVFTGCNIENASFTPTVCAERTAFFKAISEGEREFSVIAVVGGKDGVPTGFAEPCGVCRQAMREFCEDDFEIIFVKDKNTLEKHTLSELLPNSFKPDNLL